ncbi:phosphonoacetaldehyde hydrolase [Microbulbifer pacificus]|uniref:Phosphonoacetaldehyde hydrolase n=1 Tax=Microbulbifer pacificus TaxID=407164 RepID=A0AAU0MXZ6_9GAMM|nr:phosphonoacetaldehyde hydrolase [Microbulbifer pacificus]WOX04983.1 phosphonoacetaldehyde hydrolase [Microbulbifer pacificus]
MTRQLEAIIFDWAGTLVDFGSRAPLSAFMQVFADAGIDISESETRTPMGTEKQEHIRRLLQMPRIRDAWQAAHNTPATEADVARLYKNLGPVQQRAIDHHSAAVPGATAAFSMARARGLKIGTTTGYSRNMIEGMLEAAAQQQLLPDSVVAADEAPGARPGPAAALRTVIDLGISCVSACVKVDDTAPGIDEGRNAGMWTVAVVCSGNALGLSLAQWQQLDEQQKKTQRDRAYRALESCGAHYLIDDVSELEAVLVDINRRLALGETP